MMISTSPLGLRQPLRSKDAPLHAQRICSQRVQRVPRPLGAVLCRGVTVVRALGGAHDSKGTPQNHEQHHSTTITVAAKQLLSVTALAFFSLVATVVRDRATSPIIPPLIPRIDTLTSSPGADSVVQYASATVETGIDTASADTKAHVKPSRSLLRALWGTATLPVKLVDTLLFPEESLVRPSTTGSATSSSSKQTVPSICSPAADASPAAQVHPATVVAPAPASQTASPAPSFTGAAAGHVLELSSTGLDASTELQSADQAPSMPGMMHVLQEAIARMARQEQADNTAAAAPADHAAALAAVRFLMGNEGMGLLPVILVTSATAAAGLMLAATMAGLAGLVDKRRASSPAQRAAEVALLDSPLRPISCPTMPGFLPMLPPSIEPIFYRWRENDNSDSTSSNSTSSSAAAVQQRSKAPAAAEGHKAAAADVAGAAEPQQEQDWWSFSQIAALRLMPLLPTSASNNKQAAGSSSATPPDSTPAAPISTAAAAAATAPAAAAAASRAASPDASSTAAETIAGSFDEVEAALARAAAATDVDPDELALWGSDAEVLFGPAWCYAVQLVIVDALASPETAWEISRTFGAAAPAELLAEVCCFLPAAVANCRTELDLWEQADPPDTAAAGWSWDYASRITALLLGGDPVRVEAVAEAMGIVATAASPDVMHGVLQERSQLLLAEYGELRLLRDLTFGEVPDIHSWLAESKEQRVAFAEAAYRSSILATYTVLELWPEVVEAAAAQSDDAGGMDRSAGSQWQQPRLMMQHTELLDQCLMQMMQGGQEPRKVAVAKVLSISNSPVATGQRTSQLTAMQAGPPRVLRLVSTRHAALAAQQHRYSKEQLLKQKYTLDDILQTPDVHDVYWDWEEVRERVVLALRHGLLLAKPPHASMLYRFRPGWPAAQFVALAHSLLPPSEFDELLDSIKLEADDPGLLASMLMLLPAAVLHVRQHLEAELAVTMGREGLSSSTETATAVCLRIYEALLGGTGAPEHTAAHALGKFGLNPDAVAAVIAAETSEPGLAAAPAGASSGQQLYWGPSDSLLAQLFNFQGSGGVPGIMVEHAARLSFLVSLTLLLHLASSKGWERGSSPCSAPDEPLQPLTAWYWDLLIGKFADSNLYKLPGASMTAALLRTGWSEAAAAAHPSERLSAEAIALGSEQLRLHLACCSSGSSSSRSAADWQQDLTKAVLVKGRLKDICDTAEGALEIVDDEAAWRLGLAPWLDEDSCDEDEDEAWEAEEDEGLEGDAEADSSSSTDSPQADQEAQHSGSDSPQTAASYAEEEEQQDPTASQEEASSDEEEACMEDSSWGDAWEEKEAIAAAAAEAAAAAAEAAAAAAAAAAADVAAASETAYHSLMAQLEAATAEAPDALLQQLEQLSQAEDSLGREWQLALHLALADDVLDAAAAAELLRQCAATATAPLLADVCALLPAAVVNYQAAATAAGGGRQGGRAESSWDAAARLLTQLLSPAGAGSEGISKLREVCGELGLIAQARWKGDSREFRGKLQDLVESYQDEVDTLESFTAVFWETAGQFVREWLLPHYERPCQLAELALRSCVMASYLSMELWYEQDCPVVPYDPDNTGELYGAYDRERTRAALLSHYELLKHLQSSKQDSSWRLPDLITGTAGSAEDCRFVGAFMDFLRGNPPALSIFYSSPMPDTWFPALLLETGRPLCFTGKLPDLASYQDFLLVLQQVQQGMSTQLQLPQASAASGASAAVDAEASQIIEKVMRTFVMGQRVMPTRNGSHKVLRWLQGELPEWQTASQLALLWSWFPRGLDTALLQHFAASAVETSLARVCALLPAAAANVGLSSDNVTDMLDDLTAAVKGPATVMTVLEHIGLRGEVAAAAVAAAAAAAPGERVEAAAAAIRASGLQLERADGFLSMLARSNRIQTGTVPGMLVYGSIAAALPMLLDLLDDDSDDNEVSTDNHPASLDAAAAPAAAAARASSSNPSYDAPPLLPLKEWMWLAAQFAAIEAEGGAAGDAAAAALMQQGVLAAQAREQGVLPAGFRISLSKGHKASKGRVAWQDYLDVGDSAFQERAEGYGPVVLDFKGQKRGVGILRCSQALPQITGSQAAASSHVRSREPQDGAEASSAGQNPGKVTATTDPTAAAAAEAAAAEAAAASVDDTGVDSDQTSRDDKRQPKQQKSKARRQQEVDVEPGLQGAKGSSSSSQAAEQSAAAASSSAECGHDDKAEEEATTQATAATPSSSEDLVPTVKKLLGLPVDPTDASSSSSDLVPNRLALLVCQAMLMRGDDAQQKLQAAVGYLATCSMRDTLPAMLAGCMEALFTTEDWDSFSGTARQVLSSLSVALPASSYLALQKHLMAKGLVKELEVPAEFD